jgi:hypothetical protein
MAIPEKHRPTAHAFVDGAQIQARQVGQQNEYDWMDLTSDPTWNEDMEYRAKPSPERAYPALDEGEAARIAVENSYHLASVNLVAPHIIKSLVDRQQVVPMAEVQEVARGLADKRVLAVAEAVRSQCAASLNPSVAQFILALDLPAIIATVKD